MDVCIVEPEDEAWKTALLQRIQDGIGMPLFLGIPETGLVRQVL